MIIQLASRVAQAKSPSVLKYLHSDPSLCNLTTGTVEPVVHPDEVARNLDIKTILNLSTAYGETQGLLELRIQICQTTIRRLCWALLRQVTRASLVKGERYTGD